MAKKNKYVVGLDVGTTKTCAIICELNDDRHLEVLGMGSAESKGLRKGVVVNLDAAVSSIKKAVEDAEKGAGTSVESVFVGLSGVHVRSFNSRGAVAVNGHNREIGKEDIRRVIETAKAVSLPTDREIVHVLPQEFVVDGQDGIGDPLGLLGTRLEVNCHIVTSSTTAAQNIVTAVNRSGIIVADTVLQQLAAAESTLTSDDKELGVACVDIGGGTTDLAVYTQGAIRHTSILPLGGDQITNDIAVGLRTTIPEAEKIKRQFGCACSTLIEDDVSFDVPSVGGRQPKSISKKILCEIIQPRVEEIVSLVKEDIKQAGLEKTIGGGVVLTGGTVLLDGLFEVAEQIFDLPVRQGIPAGVAKMGGALSTPAYSTVIGLVLYGYRTQPHRWAKAQTNGSLWSSWTSWMRGRWS
ncbi:MAG: cell division protein FtsA [Acidimicrobiia bacterium]|nr:cell division protein FtsA [Acidimicrobiia bacterium]